MTSGAERRRWRFVVLPCPPPPLLFAQSVLVRQLERELASTVSALRDERKDKREQTEALKSKLDKARSTVRGREAELER